MRTSGSCQSVGDMRLEWTFSRALARNENPVKVAFDQ